MEPLLLSCTTHGPALTSLRLSKAFQVGTLLQHLRCIGERGMHSLETSIPFLETPLCADLMHHQELILDWSNETRWPKHIILQYRWYATLPCQVPGPPGDSDLIAFHSGVRAAEDPTSWSLCRGRCRCVCTGQEVYPACTCPCPSPGPCPLQLFAPCSLLPPGPYLVASAGLCVMTGRSMLSWTSQLASSSSLELVGTPKRRLARHR